MHFKIELRIIFDAYILNTELSSNHLYKYAYKHLNKHLDKHSCKCIKVLV